MYYITKYRFQFTLTMFQVLRRTYVVSNTCFHECHNAPDRKLRIVSMAFLNPLPFSCSTFFITHSLAASFILSPAAELILACASVADRQAGSHFTSLPLSLSSPSSSSGLLAPSPVTNPTSVNFHANILAVWQTRFGALPVKYFSYNPSTHIA